MAHHAQTRVRFQGTSGIQCIAVAGLIVHDDQLVMQHACCLAFPNTINSAPEKLDPVPRWNDYGRERSSRTHALQLRL
jgi:hypothetical protein